MSTKLTRGPILNLIGLKDGKVVPINNCICYRKPTNRKTAIRFRRRYKNAIGVVSAHNIYRKPNTPFCKLWMHCFREPEKYFPQEVPQILMSESDFVDESQIPAQKKKKSYKWDFCYFTVGGELGKTYKGFDTFVECIPNLCGHHGLRGVVVVYAKCNVEIKVRKRHRSILQRYGHQLNFIRKSGTSKLAARIMSDSRFVFFPNKVDCSPLMIPESLLRDKPVLVNEDILGGWKYVNENTGSFFTLGTIRESIGSILSSKFSGREWYMENHGYKNTATRLAYFAKRHMDIFADYDMIGFKGTGNIMEQYK